MSGQNPSLEGANRFWYQVKLIVIKEIQNAEVSLNVIQYSSPRPTTLPVYLERTVYSKLNVLIIPWFFLNKEYF